MVRYLWASPTTVIGLIVTAIARVTGGRCAVVDGVCETHGGFATWLLRRAVPLKGGASAMTLGHVVIGVDADALDRTRSHERVHVRQCERWGPLFVPAYLAASLVAWAKRRGQAVERVFVVGHGRTRPTVGAHVVKSAGGGGGGGNPPAEAEEDGAVDQLADTVASVAAESAAASFASWAWAAANAGSVGGVPRAAMRVS